MSLKVMVVDDHPMWRDGVARDLTEAGLDVVATASTGTEAITRAKATRPQVVVLDLQIPEPNGVDVTSALVEDDPAVRTSTVEILAELGYRTCAAGTAAQALELLDRHPDVSLLFTDVVMPDMNGRRLAEEALKHRPDLKVLYTTGYTRNAIVHNGVLDPGVELIMKPFSMEQLARKIAQILYRDAAKS